MDGCKWNDERGGAAKKKKAGDEPRAKKRNVGGNGDPTLPILGAREIEKTEPCAPGKRKSSIKSSGKKKKKIQRERCGVSHTKVGRNPVRRSSVRRVPNSMVEGDWFKGVHDRKGGPMKLVLRNTGEKKGGLTSSSMGKGTRWKGEREEKRKCLHCPVGWGALKTMVQTRGGRWGAKKTNKASTAETTIKKGGAMGGRGGEIIISNG